MKRKEKEKNFFEFVPKKTENIDWEINDKGLVQIIIWRNSWLDKIVQKIFKTPKKTIIDLDEIGSVVWKSINGEKNIFNISEVIEKELGSKAEPINERLVTYIKILKNNNFIELENK
ncbi:PqqD family protein [Clostridium sp. D2Q-14]|uniref:PqqD family peptide modification chaperone n=1 Tax=Anaeromonas gelatinilytica TaxID=2683194 RepID=UPI00193C3D01|nr:PqqD family peptide modification chaperone [Anaeromonas gelatinilytica]MBS4534422.1 PqqD family protein [Anaeromonas gelatinilytica]